MCFHVTYRGEKDHFKKLITTRHHEDAQDCKQSSSSGELNNDDDMISKIIECMDDIHQHERQNKEVKTNAKIRKIETGTYFSSFACVGSSLDLIKDTGDLENDEKWT